jgi:hypothetical protein
MEKREITKEKERNERDERIAEAVFLKTDSN